MTGTGRRPRPALPRPARALPLLAAALLLVPVLPAAATSVAPAPDPAASSEELQRQVDELTTQVEQLEVDAEVAVEAWNEVRAELDVLIAQELRAQGELDDAGSTLDDDRATATRRVRALYRSGGGVELAWTALNGSGFAQAATTYRTARSVIDSDAAAVVRAREGVEVAVTTSGQVQRLRRERSALETEAERRQVEAQDALLARENVLAGAGEALAAAVERERREAEQAAVAAALARAAAEQAAAEQAAQQAAAAQAAAARATAGLAPGSPADRQARGEAPAGAGTGTRVPGGVVGADAQAVIDRAAVRAPSAAAAAAVRAAGTRLGLPYAWGATGPGTFDCSGLTGWAYRQAGVGLPRTSRQQYAALPKVDPSQMLPGDLLFYARGSDPGSIHHVSIYLGDGLMLTAPRTGDVVKISALWSSPVYGAVRPAG